MIDTSASAIRVCASTVCAPTCGVATTLGCRRMDWNPGGSGSCTSRQTPPRCPLTNADSSAAMSTTEPLDTLITTAPRGIVAMVDSLTRCRVREFPGQQRKSSSASARAPFNDRHRASGNLRSAVRFSFSCGDGSTTTSEHPNPERISLTRRPIRPKPITTAVRAEISRPRAPCLFHCPSPTSVDNRGSRA